MGIFGKSFSKSKKRQEQVSAEERTRLGIKYWEQGKLDEAIKEYQEALRIDPNFALARSNLGVVYDKQGRLDDAVREWEKTLRRGVTNYVVRRNTEDWLKEARALRDERKKQQIGDVDNAVSSYMFELGQASDKWFVAYDALERIGPPAVDALIQAIESDNSLLRLRAMDLLGKIGDKRAIEALTKASNISEEDFRRMGTKPTKVAGMVIEVPLSDLLEEYRENAKKVLEKIKLKKS
ncbi:hypothetical protein ES707_20190 [subsurface metagenome]